MVSWVAAELLRTGLVDGVAHVIAANPEEDQCFFRYQISRTAEEIRRGAKRSEEHTSELQSLMRISYAVFCLKKKKKKHNKKQYTVIDHKVEIQRHLNQ